MIYIYLTINMSKHFPVRGITETFGWLLGCVFKLQPSGFLLTINKSINIYGFVCLSVRPFDINGNHCLFRTPRAVLACAAFVIKRKPFC